MFNIDQHGVSRPPCKPHVQKTMLIVFSEIREDVNVISLFVHGCLHTHKDIFFAEFLFLKQDDRTTKNRTNLAISGNK